MPAVTTHGIPARPWSGVSERRTELLRAIFQPAAADLFVVLRNAESLPEQLAGTDLDVSAMPGVSADDVVTYLTERAAGLGWATACLSRRRHMTGFSLVAGSEEALHFDVFDGITYLGFELCSTQVLADLSTVRDGVRALTAEGQVLATVLHHLSWNGGLAKPKYRADLAAALGDPSTAKWLSEQLTACFGRSLAGHVVDPRRVEELATGTGRRRAWTTAAVIARAAQGDATRPARSLVRYWSDQLGSLLHPPGLVGRTGDHLPRRPDIELEAASASLISPHGFWVPSLRSPATMVLTANGERYARTARRTWRRWSVVRRLAPSAFLLYEVKRGRVVVLETPLPRTLQALRRMRRPPSWIAAPPGEEAAEA